MPEGAYLEAPAGARAIAAAEAVAAALGRPVAGLPGAVARWATGRGAALPPRTAALALAAVARVAVGNSELRDLCEEEGSGGWLDAVADLERRLSAAAGGAPPS